MEKKGPGARRERLPAGILAILLLGGVLFGIIVVRHLHLPRERGAPPAPSPMGPTGH